MKKALKPLLLALVALVAFTSCQATKSRRVTFKNHPIAISVISELIDEETIDYKVAFRNVGREVTSFDYTIADEPGVAHIDQDGPNSGLVRNLYPGAELTIPNPVDSIAVYVTLGTVVYGKKDETDIDNIFSPDKAFKALEQPGGFALDDNPLL